MKISYNWLKQYIDIDIEPKELAKIFVNLGLEVEGVEEFETVKGGLEGLVIGEVLTAAKHPNADKLTLTNVNIGQVNPLKIVCGAPNVAAGQKVIVATIGTVLFSGDEKFTIKKSKIRGEESEGMICAEDEIGLGTSHEGIMVLEPTAKIGMSAKDYFKVETDTVFEIGLTPNRIDSASHIGTARDLAAFLKQSGKIDLKKPSIDSFKPDNASNPVEVTIENNAACHRYTGLTITGVEVKESPEWLKNRLKAVGQRPINNIVDITNYVMLETGQPLHAFDLEHITGMKVIVKTLHEGSKFVTLDGVERILSNDDLMICNTQEGMCIAGIFGGLKSGVTESTKAIFLESAYFDTVYVRRTAKKHGLNTDSSYRFERGVDPNNTLYALKRAAMLIKEIAGGHITSEVVDIYPEPVKDFRINASFFRIQRLIGKDLGKETIHKLLDALDIKIVEEEGDKLILDVPPFRVDVKKEADIVEEILRIYGYNNIEFSETLRSTVTYLPKPNEDSLRNLVSDMFSSNGFNEIMSNSLTKSSFYEESQMFNPEQTAIIINALSSDLKAMRQTLLFGGLEAIIYNNNRKNHDLKLYEFGNCYFYHKAEHNCEDPHKQYTEYKHLALFISGQKHNESWIKKQEPASFYQLKVYTDILLKRLNFNFDKLIVEEIKDEVFAYGLSYTVNKKTLVRFGLVNKKQCRKFDIENEVFYADVWWNNIIGQFSEKVEYQPISKFPEVRRDLALLIDKNIKFSEIKQIALETEKKLLKSISIFDVYEGANIGENKKSYAVSYIIQDENKTLSDDEIEKIMNKLIKAYENKLGAKIR